MSYNYLDQHKVVFTEEGQRLFLKIRDRAKELIDIAGCAMRGNIISECTGDIWDMLACVDRLVELGELQEVRQDHTSPAQHRIFVGSR